MLTTEKGMYHNPVLKENAVGLLNVTKGGIYVDATFGGGGHSAAILEQLEGGMLIAFDKDPAATQNRIDDPRLKVVMRDYRHITEVLKEMNISGVNGILADLGISSRQVDDAARGFSFRFDAPLDMRMDTTAPWSAMELINESSEEELADIFYYYGEIRSSRRLARAIVKARTASPVRTTTQLAEIAGTLAPPQERKKFLAQVFQAVRIAVNQELDSLEHLLTDGFSSLAVGGRMVFISYHSLEDRRVKNFFRSGSLDGIEKKDFYGRSLSPFKVITRKAIVPTEEEINNNPRARSAKLRAAEKIS
jgi:16S rRNA (cytosine1402-N4)-methyltransferase